jgi:hypothetical protein
MGKDFAFGRLRWGDLHGGGVVGEEPSSLTPFLLELLGQRDVPADDVVPMQ